MCGKCNIHVLEIGIAISDLFYRLKDTIETEIIIKSTPTWKIYSINKDSSIGEQIKYYRRLAGYKQPELSLKLGFTRQALHHLENQEMKLVDIKLLKGVIEELGIEDKIIINDDYIKFLLDDPCKNIIKIRERMNLTRQEFADMLEVSITSVRRWENGNSHISRNKYNKLKKCMS